MTKHKRAGLLLLAVWLLTAGTACDQETGTKEPANRFAQREILIGLIPEQNIFRQRERYDFLKMYLGEKLGVTVNFTSLSRYGNIIARFSSEKMDAAFFGSFTYALAHSQIGVEPLVRPVNLDGTSTYHGYLFARKDSRIRSAADMKGKRFAFVELATTAGYLFPLAYFKENGISDPESYLGETFFTGSHDAAIEAVLNREADAGVSKNTIYEQIGLENPRVEGELVILATSRVVPQNCLAVRKDLDPELKQALKQILLEMNENPEGENALRRFGARGFVETNDSDYKHLYELSREVGINLKKYRYENR